MNPTFSEQEYRRLLMLAYLGEWLLNAVRKDPDPAYEDLVAKLFSLTDGTPLASLASFDHGTGEWIPAERFEEDAHTHIDEYDDTTFWEELTARLTERDLIQSRGERAVNGMHPAERARAAAAIAKAYTKEFEVHGIDRLSFPKERHSGR